MKKLFVFAFAISLMAALAVSTSALEYTIDAPDDYDFGRSTSIGTVHTADGGAMKNTDASKNAALIPPAFGSESMNALNTGEYLTPNLAPGGMPASGSVIGGGASGGVTPGSTVSGGSYQPSVLFTEVTNDLYYKNSSLGRLEIPALDLNVRIYQGTDSKTLAKGIGANSYFGQIHTLDIGDRIKLTTKLGTRTYKVTDIFKVSEADRSGLADSGENMLTLYTCVRNQRDQRWCVIAAEA